MCPFIHKAFLIEIPEQVGQRIYLCTRYCDKKWTTAQCSDIDPYQQTWEKVRAPLVPSFHCGNGCSDKTSRAASCSERYTLSTNGCI